jgi:hypothetical protein
MEKGAGPFLVDSNTLSNHVVVTYQARFPYLRAGKVVILIIYCYKPL